MTTNHYNSGQHAEEHREFIVPNGGCWKCSREENEQLRAQLSTLQAKLDAAVALAGILHRLVDDGVILYAGRVSDRERSTMIRLERRIATESEFREAGRRALEESS